MKIKNIFAFNDATDEDIIYMELPKKIFNMWDEGGQIYLNRWSTDCNVDDRYFLDEDHLFVTREGLETIDDIEYLEDDDTFYDDNEGFPYYSLRSLVGSNIGDFGVITTESFGSTIGVICSSFNN